MYKVILTFSSDKLKEIESIEFETLEEAQESAIAGKELYGAVDYKIKSV